MFIQVTHIAGIRQAIVISRDTAYCLKYILLSRGVDVSRQGKFRCETYVNILDTNEKISARARCEQYIIKSTGYNTGYMPRTS